MTNEHGDHGGAFAHCVFHCNLRRRHGTRASEWAECVHNNFFEEGGEASESDIAAKAAGQEAASGSDSCVDKCLKRYPRLP